MKRSSLEGESCVDGKIEELSSTARVSGSPSGAAAVSLRDSVSVCDVLICHLLKYNGEQMNCRWVANTHPHTRTHAKRHREICSIHRTGSHYITVDSLWNTGNPARLSKSRRCSTHTHGLTEGNACNTHPLHKYTKLTEWLTNTHMLHQSHIQMK